LRRVAERLDAERSTDFDTLPLDGMPSEVRPFVDSINRLLARIGTMVDQRKHFIADAAHELRTPITALSLQAANLGAGELTPQSRARLEALNLGVRRIAHLLEQLLALTRYDTGTTARTSASSLDVVARESVADLLPLAAARGIDLGFARIEAVVVRAEATALAVLLRNLVGNAVRYTPAGGRIDIDVHREGAGAVARVSDSGPGIAPGDLDLVFEPFYRGALTTEEGSGLGLSIVRRIVDGFGGTITLENKPGPGRSGLVVTVSVPAVP
jgi:two-component system OmpR family sensor kinase